MFDTKHIFFVQHQYADQVTRPDQHCSDSRLPRKQAWCWPPVSSSRVYGV